MIEAALEPLYPYLLSLLRRTRLWRVVVLTCLDHELFVIVSSVAVDVYFHNDFVLLAVSNLSGIETKAVLATQQRIYAAQDFGNFAFKGVREKRAACLLRE